MSGRRTRRQARDVSLDASARVKRQAASKTSGFIIRMRRHAEQSKGRMANGVHLNRCKPARLSAQVMTAKTKLLLGVALASVLALPIMSPGAAGRAGGSGGSDGHTPPGRFAAGETPFGGTLGHRCGRQAAPASPRSTPAHAARGEGAGAGKGPSDGAGGWRVAGVASGKLRTASSPYHRRAASS